MCTINGMTFRMPLCIYIQFYKILSTEILELKICIFKFINPLAPEFSVKF
jgi:hypothetical protein